MIEITLPLKLVSEANNRDHWRTKNARKQKILAMLNTYWTSDAIELPCEITLTRVSPRRLDWDNNVCAFKGIRDMVADKLIPGLRPGRADDDDRLTWIYRQESRGPKVYSVIIRFSF